jgi:2-(1,2-epoxy-1,2-dihydrophenyl)acetyl-CoA isomerase
VSKPSVSLTYPRSGVALITLERPEIRNAVDFDSLKQLRETLLFLKDESEAVRAIVMTGRGTAFCSGSDQRTSPKRGSNILSYSARLEAAHEVLRLIYRMPKLVMSAVNGPAVGVGWSLALASDLTVASETAYFWAGFYGVAQVPDAGAPWFLERLLGRQRALEVLLLNEPITAKRAMEWGLVNRVVAPEKLIDETVNLCSQVVAGSPDALLLTKTILRQVVGQSLEETFDSEAVILALNNFSPEKAAAREAAAKRHKAGRAHGVSPGAATRESMRGRD